MRIVWRRGTHMAYINTKHLHYQKLPRSFFQEASTLAGEGYSFSEFRNGFDLVSHRTGESIPMTLTEITRDREGEIVGWNYIPAEHEERRITSVIILND